MRALIILLLLVVGFFWLSKPEDQNSPARVARMQAEASRVAAVEERLNRVKLEKFSWEKGGFDNVMLANFIIKNTGDAPVKDIVIACEHTANSGTMIDSNTRTVFEAIKAHGSKSVRKFNMGLINTQVARSSCKVAGFADG